MKPELADKKSRVRDWLARDEWDMTPTVDDAARWAYKARHPGGVELIIGEPYEDPESIHISGFIHPDAAELIGLEEDERQELLWELRFELLRMGVDYEGTDYPLGRVRVSKRIFDDGLTRDALIERVGQVYRAALFVQMHLSHWQSEEVPGE